MKPESAKTDPGLGGATIVEAPKSETPSTARLIPAAETAPRRDRLSLETDPRLALVATHERDLVRGLGRDAEEAPLGSVDTLPMGPAIVDEPPSRLAFATDPRLALASPEDRALLRGLGKASEPEPAPALPPVEALVAATASRGSTASLAGPKAPLRVEAPRPKRPGATTVRLRLASWELGRFAVGIVVVVIVLMALLVWVLREPKQASPSTAPSASPSTLHVEGPTPATAPTNLPPSPVTTASAALPASPGAPVPSASAKPLKPHTSAIGPGTSEPGPTAVPTPKPPETAPAPVLSSPPAPKASGPDPLHLQGM